MSSPQAYEACINAILTAPLPAQVEVDDIGNTIPAAQYRAEQGKLLSAVSKMTQRFPTLLPLRSSAREFAVNATVDSLAEEKSVLREVIAFAIQGIWDGATEADTVRLQAMADIAVLKAGTEWDFEPRCRLGLLGILEIPAGTPDFVLVYTGQDRNDEPCYEWRAVPAIQ